MRVITRELSSYDGGLNDTVSPREAAPDEATVLRNWDLTYKGKLTRRDGLTLVGDAAADPPIMGLGAYIRDSGTDLLSIHTTSLRYLNGTTWTTLTDGLTAGTYFTFANVQSLGRIYFCNENNVLRYWDRSSTTLNSSITSAAATVPHGDVLVWHKNYMFTLNNVNVNGTIYSNRLYWSNLGDPDTWDTTNNQFEIPGDGRAITALDLGDTLVIFKERSIQYLDGFGDASWRITSTNTSNVGVSNEVGIAGPMACCKVENDVWFLDDEGYIRSVTRTDQDNYRTTLISTKILGTHTRINRAQMSKAVMYTWNNKVYCAVPVDTNTTNNLVIVFDILAAKRQAELGRKAESWTTYTGWNVNVIVDMPNAQTPALYIGDALTGRVYQHIGVDDNGVAIDAWYEGSENDDGKPDIYKRNRFGYVRGSTGSGNISVGIYASVDQAPYENLGSLNLLATGSRLGPTGSFLLGPTGNAKLGGGSEAALRFEYGAGGGSPTGKTIRHSIRHNTLGQKPTINTLTSHFQLRDPR